MTRSLTKGNLKITMSLPDEKMNELLSAHLDGALSDQERLDVEQLLADDQEVQEAFDRMQAMRDSFRMAMQVPAGVSLREDFAQHVVQAAIEQSAEFDSSHPLSKAARSEPSKVLRQEPSKTSSRNVWYAVAVAAAIMMVATLAWKRFADQQPNGDLAKTNQQPNGDQPASPNQQRPDQQRPDIEQPRPDQALAGNDSTTLPSTALIPKSADPLEDKPGVADPINSVANADVGTSPPSAMSGSQANNSAVPMIDKPGLQSSPLDHPGLVSSGRPKAVGALKVLPVIDVQLTEAGRDADAFGTALQAAGFKVGAEQEVDDDLAAAAIKKHEKQDGESSLLVQGAAVPAPRQVMLLYAPAKKLDRFILTLHADREGVSHVGFSMLISQLDPELVKSIESAKPLDSTTVQHQGSALPMVTQLEEQFDAWSDGLADRSFLPVDENFQGASMTPSAAGEPLDQDNGPDVMAVALFLIK